MITLVAGYWFVDSGKGFVDAEKFINVEVKVILRQGTGVWPLSSPLKWPDFENSLCWGWGKWWSTQISWRRQGWCGDGHNKDFLFWAIPLSQKNSLEMLEFELWIRTLNQFFYWKPVIVVNYIQRNNYNKFYFGSSQKKDHWMRGQRVR